MASTYVNDLRLNEMATGDQSGSWGTVTNTNLELIGEAFSFGTEAITTNADTHTTTIADGATDPGRSMYLKYTGALDSACTITIGPNTVSKMWFIENATTGSQNIIVSQGSGANVTIAAGQTKAVYSDGAGSGAAFVDAFAALSVAGVSPTELGVLDGITASTAELNYNDITTLGTVQASKVVTADSNADVTFGDNDKAIFGAGSDLQIYHDSTDSLIKDKGQGDLRLTSNGTGIIFLNDNETETLANFQINGAVSLYYDNALKLATTSSGISVTGAVKPTTYQETYVANSTGATTTLDLSTGTNFSVTLSENTTFVFSNPPSSGTAYAFTLVITQPSSAKTITWPSSVDWAGGTAPDAPGNSEVNAYGFMTRDGGTTYYGFLGGAALG